MLEPGQHQDQVNIAEAAAQRAVERTLITLGFDVTDPLRAQGQMAALRIIAERIDNEELIKDAEFVRRLRIRIDTITDTSLRATVRYTIYFIFGLLAVAAGIWWRKSIPW
jgi:hypothetical protein